MRTPSTTSALRGAVAGAGLVAVLATGTATADAAAPLQDPAPAVATRGMPVERLPQPPVEPDDSQADPVLPAGSVPLGIGGAVLVVLVLRSRRLAAPGPSDRARGPLPTGTAALLRALAAALADDGPVGLVLLRVEARPGPDRASSSGHSVAADAVLEALDAAVPLVAAQVAHRSRGADQVMRLGVNRLAVVLPGSGPGEARTVAERLRSSLAESAAPGLSVAVGSAGSPGDGTLPAALHRAAERGLQAAAAVAAT